MLEKFINWFNNHFRARNPHEITVENVPVKPELPRVTPFVRKASAAGISRPLPTKDRTKLYPMPPPQVRSTARPPTQRQIETSYQEEDNTTDALLSAMIVSSLLQNARVENAPQVETFQGGGGGSGGAGASGSWDDSPIPQVEEKKIDFSPIPVDVENQSWQQSENVSTSSWSAPEPEPERESSSYTSSSDSSSDSSSSFDSSSGDNS